MEKAIWGCVGKDGCLVVEPSGMPTGWCADFLPCGILPCRALTGLSGQPVACIPDPLLITYPLQVQDFALEQG